MKGMPLLAFAAVLIVITTLSAAQRPGSWTAEPQFRLPNTMSLIGVHENNRFFDVSENGSSLILYQTAAQTRLMTGNNKYAHDDLLRVVDIESGRELARADTEFFPSSVKFVPDSKNVFYVEPENPSKYALKIWNYSTGESARCSDKNSFGLSNVTFFNRSMAVAALLDDTHRQSLLVKIGLPGCVLDVIGPADPSDPKRYRVFGPLSVSPGGNHVAYKVPAVNLERIIVRDTATGDTVTNIEPRGLYLNPKTVYTDDGRFLIALAANTGIVTSATKRYLLFYDAKNYELKRQLDITTWDRPDSKPTGAELVVSLGTAWAVSPDGRLIAVGYRTADGRQPYIVLYDLASGKELCRAAYPPISPRQNDPFLGTIGSLAFTPDGKTLVSSTHDTRIWRLDSVPQDKQ
jgi:WD40 repeat protein